MPVALSRVALRHSRLLIRRTAFRQNSTASEAAAKTKDAASSAASKASEGLSKVTATAGPAIAGAVSGIGALIPPTIYYSRVAFEVSKIVFHAQKMAPPNLATFQAYFQPFLASLRTPSTAISNLNISSYITKIKSMDRKQLAIVGVTAAEIIGFFSVGEMLGRMKIVGYRGEPSHEH
ncbi:ATP synthase subunit G atp20 [Ophidiomyces ophidiicola]|nr:ATP synthase subunit G atp20 [Ophidiomyces ophidiicola]KAI1928843.1 ATP synthase subunit G atp20 [Ophidiomyces ophidiicola]KAI1960115.1 ATP synthase subunit G atp20 [Ophidiomyces ophidiicola]KAI1970579.1 ATP synthase subunit G atp20 [Ophidiomyces ophidiicola]KAI1983105.1 ATP synthase subunit G atp20 [Ophidiomyces ophidiicola]